MQRARDQRSKSSRPTTIHGFAQSGDLNAFHKMLNDNPSLLNERNPVYGETPLHMAAKNGCNEAAKLLLSHGALVEARANNGMTPLHLAVWHSIRVEDYSTVKTLLEHNADCSVKDNV
nr:protein CfxQ homolog [Ipomoea batatas]